MSSSNSRKKNTRFYWAELGFIGLGLVGLNPNLIGELMGGNSESAIAVREATKALAEDLMERTKASVSQNIQGHQNLTSLPTGAVLPTAGGIGQYGYTNPVGYPNALPPAIVYGNQVYYPQLPAHSYPYAPQPNQPSFNYQESTAQLANMFSDALRRLAFDQSTSQQSASQQYNQQSLPSTDYTRQAQLNSVPPAEYPNSTDQRYMAQMPASSGFPVSTNIVRGYDSNYPTATYPNATSAGLSNYPNGTATLPSTSGFNNTQNFANGQGFTTGSMQSYNRQNDALNRPLTNNQTISQNGMSTNSSMQPQTNQAYGTQNQNWNGAPQQPNTRSASAATNQQLYSDPRQQSTLPNLQQQYPQQNGLYR